ncbi:hypothetical protein ARMGADRAFT_951173, partial [Armillaria gallica]
LQPGWRGLEGKDPFGLERRIQNEGEWMALVKPGQNGLYSVVASLAWWGMSVDRNSKAWEEWMMAMRDIIWVLECVTRRS